MMPSALNVQLSVLLSVVFCQLDASPLYSSMGELSETSGEELQDVNVRAPLTEAQRWHMMAKQLHQDVNTLQNEQFHRDFSETLNITSFEGVRINTPVLKASDGCLSRNFNMERCLGRIYSVLMWYDEHLSYIEKENLTLTLVNDVKHGTKRLLESINNQLQLRDTQVEEVPRSSLQVTSAWTRKTLAHSILFHFTNVMIDTCRAVHYMSKRKTGQQEKSRKKPMDWIFNKN